MTQGIRGFTKLYMTWRDIQEPGHDDQPCRIILNQGAIILPGVANMIGFFYQSGNHCHIARWSNKTWHVAGKKFSIYALPHLPTRKNKHPKHQPRKANNNKKQTSNTSTKMEKHHKNSLNHCQTVSRPWILMMDLMRLATKIRVFVFFVLSKWSPQMLLMVQKSGEKTRWIWGLFKKKRLFPCETLRKKKVVRGNLLKLETRDNILSS